MWLQNRKPATGKTAALADRISLRSCVWLLLPVSWTVSFFLSIDKQEAFWGQQAKCTGLLLYVIGALSIWFLGRYLVWSPILSWLFLIAAGIVCQLQILNRWGIDPFGMYSNLVEEEKSIFISTIGQVNYNAALDCLILAVLLVWFLLSKDRFSRIVYGAVLVLAYGGAICCCSDSFYLALVVMFAALLCYVYAHPEKWLRLSAALILFDAAALGIWICWSYVAPAKFWGISTLLFDMKLHWMLTGAMWLVVILGYLCSTRWKKVWKWYCPALLVLVPAGGVLAWSRSFSASQLQAQLDSSGGRLEIWSKVWRTWNQAPLIHKLWGYGFNNVNQALACFGENQLGAEQLMDAHNIFLNSLLTSGFVGTAFGVAFLIWLFVRSVRSLRENEMGLLGCMIVLAYAAQGMVNGPQVLTEPVYLVGFGVAAAAIRGSCQWKSSQ
jgi:hypothetical protein